jgi:hypothetical protein
MRSTICFDRGWTGFRRIGRRVFGVTGLARYAT